MQPIVYGLEEEFGGEVLFLFVDAADGTAGQSYFVSLGLRGHPAVLIFRPGGEEAYRALGLVTEDELRDALAALLEK